MHVTPNVVPCGSPIASDYYTSPIVFAKPMVCPPGSLPSARSRINFFPARVDARMKLKKKKKRGERARVRERSRRKERRRNEQASEKKRREYTRRSNLIRGAHVRAPCSFREDA